MTDAGAGRQVAEWWQPDVGQRVRYRKSSECPGYGTTPDGVTGTVVDVAPYERLRDGGIEHPEHRFEVRFDYGYVDRCCAQELEPAAQPPDRATVPETTVL